MNTKEQETIKQIRKDLVKSVLDYEKMLTKIYYRLRKLESSKSK